MLTPEEFLERKEKREFFVEGARAKIAGSTTGSISVKIEHNESLNPVFHLAVPTSASDITDVFAWNEQEMTLSLPSVSDPISLILKQTQFDLVGKVMLIQAVPKSTPIVFHRSESAASFKAVLLSAPKFIGQKLSLVDSNGITFEIRAPSKDGSSFFLVYSNLDLKASDPTKPVEVFLDFLSFAKGTFCGFGNLQALDQNGIEAFSLLGFSKNDSERPMANWCGYKASNRLEEIFLLFSRASEDQKTKQALRQAISFYRASNASRSVSIEMALIAAHGSLEALVNYTLEYRAAWVREMLDNRQIKFSDKMRAALAFFGLSGNILEKSPELTRLAKGRNGCDGFDIISLFRNKVVHQDEKFRPRGIELHEAWLLSQWLTEILIFSIIGYRGLIDDQRVYSGWAGATCEIPIRG